MALEGAALIKGTVEAKGGDSVKADVDFISATRPGPRIDVRTRSGTRSTVDRAEAAGGLDGNTKTEQRRRAQLESSFARPFRQVRGRLSQGSNPESGGNGTRRSRMHAGADLDNWRQGRRVKLERGMRHSRTYSLSPKIGLNQA